MAKKYENIEVFEDKVKEYFDIAEEKKKPFTQSGLCLHLGVVKSTLTNYRKREGFKEVLEYASLRIENYLEEGIITGDINVTGAIFNLKNNFNWTDRREETIDHNNQVVFKFDRSMSDLK